MKLRRLLPAIVLLIAMLACVLPGLDVPASGFADPNMVSTTVASTANAAASQTAAAQPPATETPAGPAVPRATGTTMEQLETGITKYSDYDGGFEVVFPAGWLAVRPNSDEFNASLASAGADNPVLHEQMTSDLAEYEATTDRIYSYILRPDIKKKTIFGFSKLVFASEDSTSLDNWTMGELTRGLESSGVIPGFRADTAQLRENANGVQIIEIGGRFALGDGQGGSTPLYATIVVFKPTSNSLVRMTFTMLQEFHAEISPDVKSIIESINVPDL